MRVTRPQIINGLTGYIQQEILPKMEDDRALKILFSVAVNAIKANDKLIDKYLSNDIVKALIDDDGSGTLRLGPSDIIAIQRQIENAAE